MKKFSFTASTSNQELLETLEEFNGKLVSPKTSVDWDFNEQKKTLASLLAFLTEESRAECHVVILRALKIFSRNKSLLESAVSTEMLDELLKQAGISLDETARKDLSQDDETRILEAQRCLSNIYLQCHKAQDMALVNDTLPGVMAQMTKYKEYKISPPIISFDMKILFLITAQRTESRTVVVVEHQALSRLTASLELLLESAKVAESALSDEQTGAMCDILKALFNLTCGYENKTCDEEESAVFNHLGQLLQTLVIVDIPNVEQKTHIVSNSVNLLTNYQAPWMGTMIAPFLRAYAPKDLEDIQCGDKCMNAIQVLLDFLDLRVTQMDGNKAHLHLRENVAPILKVLTIMCASHRSVRKYLRHAILPPLKDVTQRPEVGSSLKSKLCRLLTSPDTTVGSMVAEFMFILCKEKVSRFVKHTGYGNAAGLLARRGLMLGEKVESKYSSSDSDSDTDEYVANAHKINPVTGHVEPPRKSPFEGMTEEQKEYEAHQLANLIHQLHELGAIKPGKIGPDGKPVAVEHVLELTEGQKIAENRQDDNDESDEN